MAEKKVAKTPSSPVNEAFHHFARIAATVTGSAWAFIFATIIIVLWLISGPFFKFSDTWQLFINTGTTILTFLMVFLIQNTQNRDAVAMHLKLDELIRAVEKARNQLVDLEDLSDDELAKLQKEFVRLSKVQDGAVETIKEEKDEAVETIEEEKDAAVETIAEKKERQP